MEGSVLWTSGDPQGAVVKWNRALDEATKNQGRHSYDAGVACFLLGRFEKPSPSRESWLKAALESFTRVGHTTQEELRLVKAESRAFKVHPKGNLRVKIPEDSTTGQAEGFPRAHSSTLSPLPSPSKLFVYVSTAKGMGFSREGIRGLPSASMELGSPLPRRTNTEYKGIPIVRAKLSDQHLKEAVAKEGKRRSGESKLL